MICYLFEEEISEESPIQEVYCRLLHWRCFLAEAEGLRKKMKTIDISAAEMIREDRDAR